MAHENATPRPWMVDPSYPSEVQTLQDLTVSSCWHEHASGSEITVTGVLECSLDESAANAALIVEAVNAYEVLTAERDRLAAENERLRSALAAAEEHLEYSGYGDAYERECAILAGLPIKIAEALLQKERPA